MKRIPFYGPEFDRIVEDFRMETGRDVSKLCAQIHREWVSTALRAVERAKRYEEEHGGFDVSSLSEEEAFALSYVAGAPVTYAPKEDGRLGLRTAPCSLVWNGEMFLVHIREETVS